MAKIRPKTFFGLIFAVLIILFSFSPQFLNIYSLPPHMRIIQGENALFTVNFPLTIDVQRDTDSVRLTSSVPVYAFSRPISLETVKMGRATVEFKLLGLVPIRTVQVDVLPTIKLVPGGHSIGVVLHSQGIIVVGNSPVQTLDGRYITPAKDAGIEIGDVILGVNGTTIENDMQLADVIDNAGKNKQEVSILVKRGNSKLEIKVLPAICKETKRYRIGLFVRDSAAGVGTLTFCEPNSHFYGALGHIITDSDTNQPIDCEKGKIVSAVVSGIQQGKRGQPGEKIGVFIEEERFLGDIQKNTPFGIYGKMAGALENPVYPEALPVASMSQVHTGDAEILTVIDGQTIEKFSIMIEKVILQDVPEGKGLVLKITDPRLLEKTGGIVQGMSGSPIIQNGKMVGAVTHVFVHDPTRGYGCFIDWMLMEGGLIPHKDSFTARKLFAFSGFLHYKKNFKNYASFFHTRKEMTWICRITFS